MSYGSTLRLVMTFACLVLASPSAGRCAMGQGRPATPLGIHLLSPEFYDSEEEAVRVTSGELELPDTYLLEQTEPSPEVSRKSVRRAEATMSGQLPPQAVTPRDGQADLDLGMYHGRIAAMSAHDDTLFDAIEQIPDSFEPWWHGYAASPLRPQAEAWEVGIDYLVSSSLQWSPQVLAVRSETYIRQTSIAEEAAQFDWRTFLESRWRDINEPVGNTLTTGGPNRFKDKNWTSGGGLRRKNIYGGQFEAAQRLGFQNTNSRFFIPQDQGTARFELNYTQPLLNGAGEFYNQGRIILAQLENEAAQDQVQEQLQEHLLRVTEAYWELFRARAVFLQRTNLLGGAQRTLALLEGRQEVDVMQRQVLRAQAAVTSRQAEIARAAAGIRNAESRLRLLVNSPDLLESPSAELVPVDLPLNRCMTPPLDESLHLALLNRPDISKAIRKMRTNSTRLKLAEQDVLPRLDLVLSSYVAGLRGESNIPNAYTSMFDEGRPSYTAGLLFEFPLGNRAARAGVERREWEFYKAVQEFRATVESSLTEVQLAVREANTACREVFARYQSLAAAQNEAEYLNDRWVTVPGNDRAATLLLEDLLDAQKRVADEEGELVAAQVQYLMAIAQTRRATGTLCSLNGTQLALEPLDTSNDQPTIAPASWKSDASATPARKASSTKPTKPSSNR